MSDTKRRSPVEEAINEYGASFANYREHEVAPKRAALHAAIEADKAQLRDESAMYKANAERLHGDLAAMRERAEAAEASLETMHKGYTAINVRTLAIEDQRDSLAETVERVRAFQQRIAPGGWLETDDPQKPWVELFRISLDAAIKGSK